jgi:hypothetical protein
MITARLGLILAVKKQNTANTATLKQKINSRDHDPLYYNIQLTVDELDIQQQLRNTATFDVATDGSFNNATGISSYGWVITLNRTVIAKAQGPVPAYKIMAEPFRAEIHGVASASSFINMLMDHMNDNAIRHKWFCLIDNTSVIRKLEKYSTTKITPKWHLLPDADILEYTVKQAATIPFNFIHVKSHQDRNSGKMSFDAQMNCMADELAQRQNASMITPYTQSYPKFCHLSINNMIITRDSQKWLRDSASQIPI